MYVYSYIYVYIHVCMYIYSYIYVYIHVTHAHTHYVCMCVCMHVLMYVCMGSSQGQGGRRADSAAENTLSAPLALKMKQEIQSLVSTLNLERAHRVSCAATKASIAKILRQLTGLKASVEVLAASQINKHVKHLAKDEAQDIAAPARDLVLQWRSIVQRENLQQTLEQQHRDGKHRVQSLNAFKQFDKDSIGARLKGSRIEVYWSQDRQWFAGTLRSYDPRTQHYRIVYDDGDKESVRLEDIKYRWPDKVSRSGPAKMSDFIVDADDEEDCENAGPGKCHVCKSGKNAQELVTCRACRRGWHTGCLLAPVSDRSYWRCPLCVSKARASDWVKRGSAFQRRQTQRERMEDHLLRQQLDRVAWRAARDARQDNECPQCDAEIEIDELQVQFSCQHCKGVFLLDTRKQIGCLERKKAFGLHQLGWCHLCESGLEAGAGGSSGCACVVWKAKLYDWYLRGFNSAEQAAAADRAEAARQAERQEQQRWIEAEIRKHPHLASVPEEQMRWRQREEMRQKEARERMQGLANDLRRRDEGRRARACRIAALNGWLASAELSTFGTSSQLFEFLQRGTRKARGGPVLTLEKLLDAAYVQHRDHFNWERNTKSVVQDFFTIKPHVESNVEALQPTLRLLDAVVVKCGGKLDRPSHDMLLENLQSHLLSTPEEVIARLRLKPERAKQVAPKPNKNEMKEVRDDGEDVEITAVTHVTDPVASVDLCQERADQDKREESDTDSRSSASGSDSSPASGSGSSDSSSSASGSDSEEESDNDSSSSASELDDDIPFGVLLERSNRAEQRN